MLTDNVREGLRYAASIAGVDVEVYKESVLETNGLYWLSQKLSTDKEVRSRKLEKAPKALKDQVDAILE